MPARRTGGGSRPRRGPAVGGSAAGIRLERRVPDAAPAPELDAQQQAVVDHRDGHLLVLAGPGTGKTTTLTELVVSRLAPGPDRLEAGSVLALTFGRRAAQELSERISRRLGGGQAPVVSTFHSFAYGVLRQYADPLVFASPPRLLTAAEQESRLRELLTWSIREGRLEWPESLSRAVGTRGIAEQVRALLARARGLGLDGPALARAGRTAGIPVWTSVGRFFQEYLDTLGFEGTLDYAELIHQAGALASKERAGRALRETYRLIVVDEYQDTDPAQVRLLRELARGGAQVVAVGDPDQAIYGFRGADVGGILQFAERFRDPATGAPARIEVLRTTRRFPRPIADAAHRVLGPVPLTGLPVEVQRLHRNPRARRAPARVSARTYPSVAAEGAGIAELLLRARAGLVGQPPLAWSQMAVLVRSPAVQGPPLVRALRVAGIPVAVPQDELALADEPAVNVILGILGLAMDPARAPDDTGRLLLSGPIGRVDPVALRALARAALHERRAGIAEAEEVAPGADSGAGDQQPALGGVGSTGPAAGSGGADATGPAALSFGSDAALTEALARGEVPQGGHLPASAKAGFARVARAIVAAQTALLRGDMVAEVLWSAWSATDWPERLRQAALRSGSGGVGAHRDLDALVALFDQANRLPAQRRGRVGVEAFVAELREQRLPQDVRPPAEVQREQVRLLSAHRAKGQEWDLVVVAGVQEGQWPDVRLRGDVLRVEELGSEGRREQRTHTDLLAEERRLMYVACTRARSTLVVTAVSESLDGGAQPSRFLSELGVEVLAMPARPTAPLAGPGLITALRAAAAAPERRLADGRLDPEVEALRGAAIVRLATLARHARGARGAGLGGALAAADPHRWWGVSSLAGPEGGLAALGEVPLPGASGEIVEQSAEGRGDRPEAELLGALAGGSGDLAPGPDGGVRLSPSAVEALCTCPLRWFLERKVGAGSPGGGAAAIGVVVHAVAEAVTRREVEPELSAIAPLVDEIWASMPFPARYQRDQERARVDEMIAALLAWHRSTGRTAVAAEAQFILELPAIAGGLTVAGKVDRIDRSEDGHIHLVDFKTGRTAASAAAAAEHPQLGVYQLAAREGALADTDAGQPVPGEAELGLGDLGSGRRRPEPSPGAAEPQLGGAELVHLADRYASGMPKVRHQAPLDEGWTWVHDLVLEAARLAAGPRYPARRNDRCGACPFRFMCPAHAPGGGLR